MSKHEKYTRLKRQIGLCLITGVALFSAAPMAFAATSVIANNTLPSGGKFVHGNGSITRPNDLQMNVVQNEHNAVIKWEDFSVGGSATVNFNGPDAKYNTLNYVNTGNISQIYGTINANNNGNIYIVNPAGVQIGNSAQINVGSLYVSNKNLDDAIKKIQPNQTVQDIMNKGTITSAELMSLGNINATNVTFEGDGRIVIDTERLKDVSGHEKLSADKIIVNTTDDTSNLIVGYDAYDKTNGGYAGKNNGDAIATVNNGTFTKQDGYMWVEDVDQLQAINTNLGGNYALRNSIDATGTAASGFNPIGLDSNTGKVNVENRNYGFYGKFDGMDYNIFGLTINQPNKVNVGLFGVAHNATINNVTLVSGSITGGSVVGSVVGAAIGNTHISNATNSAAVTGNTDVGGIVGYTGNEIDNVGNSNASQPVKTDATFENLINTGTIRSNGSSDNNSGAISNVGGLIGYMYNGMLYGNSYNLGNVSGDGYNVGGLVGHAVNSTIGDGKKLVYNRLDVTGAYNVGGIVGKMEQDSTVQNAENSGNVTATGYDKETYTFHTNHYKGETTQDITGVHVANIGGIAGNVSASTLKDVTNSGDAHSNQQAGNDFYDAGNVGGIVGKAVDTNIENAINRENDIRGAHNVGGVVGYFGSSNDSSGSYTVQSSANNGGDIMATGARNGQEYVKELIRFGDQGGEENIVGNMGGVVGYLDGDNVYIKAGANRGTVHSLDITDGANVSDASKAANTGGIVGKIDRNKTASLDELKNGTKQAAVSDSYNTGDVRGYMGVGGVAGMMYNGEITGSYNLGTINTTRRTGDVADAATKRVSVNMGGIVGDTTEQTSAHVVLYDVYNKGQIGDETYTFYARHVGGIVGRLSGYVDKAYNAGAIYNGYNVVGGIAGWFYKGGISNSFNTGNITVVNNNTEASSQVGGIVGAVGMYANKSDLNGDRGWELWDEYSYIENAYNLGTIRSFQNQDKKENTVGGIVGYIAGDGTGNSQTELKLNITNVYTTGNLYAQDKDGNSVTNGLGTIIGEVAAGATSRFKVTNGYYIEPDSKSFQKLSKGHHTKLITYDSRFDKYEYDGFDFTTTSGDKNANIDNEDRGWRWYDNSTPILNAFLPHSEDYFSGEKDRITPDLSGIGSIQYGTAYDPLLTIIKADGSKNDLNFNWQDLGINNDAGIAVYGAGLTLDDFKATGGSGYFGGLIYSDGALNINANVTDTNKDKVTGDVSLGSSSQLYGSSVSINADGDVVIYGTVTATGNTNNDPNIIINAGNVDVYGKLTAAAEGESFSIPGIDSMAEGWTPGTVGDPYEAMSDIGDRFAYTTGESKQNGDITIVANGTEKDDAGNIIDGNVNLFFGNQEQGLITAGGSLKVEAQGDVFVDSDLDIGGNMKLTSKGANGEVLLTLTNIGKVQADRVTEAVESAINGQEITSNNKDTLVSNILTAVGKVEGITEDEAQKIANALISSVENGKTTIQAVDELNETIAVEYMHDFMHSFNTDTHNRIDLNVTESGSAKLTVDMWDDGAYDFKKYDNNNHTFQAELNNLKFYINGKEKDAKDFVYVEVSNGEQLKGIQAAGKDALGYNYALMGDINASGVKDYEAIGTGSTSGFTGTFDGRGNRIIGLNVNSDQGNAGIFDTVGEGGTVKDVNIYSGNFTGASAAGAVAGVNKGRIEGVVTFGNTVTSDGNAGGIAGMNKGKGNFDEDGLLTGSGVYDVESTGSVIAGSNTVAGGLVGTNEGSLGNSYSDSAVTVTTGITTSSGLGGVVGSNTGDVQFVDSLGVTNGGATGSSNVGGIIGINEGKMYSGYNESIVSGQDNVGGIIGKNGDTNTVEGDANTVENVVNATSVDGNDYVGGLVGSNGGSVTNGRNNGEINGHDYVGGLVGSNASADSVLTNLVNDSSASITGENFVGGIAGTNAGKITADEQETLVNRGDITGQNYVGGVAGENIGTIEYVKNDVTLHVADENQDAQFFGGVAGINGRVDDPSTRENEAATGTITNATNRGDVIAENADYVGGIVGWNTAKGVLTGMGNSNEGRVEGNTYVGGVAGLNDAAITGTAEEMVGITNSGVVIAHGGGAGGIFGVNAGKIEYAHISNTGIVSGTDSKDSATAGTGGLVGVNNGDIIHSSLTNELSGQVMGTQNVGGLIGINTGKVSGGRDAADSYYKYQVYNNGVVNAGTWHDSDGDGIVDEGEFAVVQNGQNIGGLVGTNNGAITAAYNTGVVNGNGSTNVGGIAGTNRGTIDQVFNTIFDSNGKDGMVNGGTNVGGLVGWNAGVLSNAYNTSQVSGTNTVGNLVGQNDNAVKNVYATVTGKLIGNGSLAQNGYVAEDTQEWKNHGSYDGFDFDNDGGRIWKNYDGYGTPLLKVFLTKAFYDPATGQLVSAADGFNAHYNAEGGLIFSGMGTESNYLWSEQIRFGNGNPNWLGYDLVAMPDIPAWEFPGGRWDYLYSDAPFDRNRDFRERKAEINFVDGGMEL
ncbi:hypothetical protein CJ260_06845 [Megasphaera sp. ASD88]|uniref:beta strand repeat-containing protein n=1 Tax=Megasphaera sp. ASD88 TaxID=2027407 RepID=UPI000BAC0855|nr:filamentous hemagglutinin N-terminal domain-containing protein [Megasphaera sp. ASD88]PAV38867.1 hypothetical protein CJ260_06845 [Megasphaera sp. ASD88]